MFVYVYNAKKLGLTSMVINLKIVTLGELLALLRYFTVTKP